MVALRAAQTLPIILALLMPVIEGVSWGTFNPGTYMGLRAKIDIPGQVIEGLNAGVMWGSGAKLHHQIRDNDHVQFTYDYNDPGRFSVQQLVDTGNALNITQTWTTDGGDDWTLQIEGKHAPRTKYDTIGQEISLVFYYTVESMNLDHSVRYDGSAIKLVNKDREVISKIDLPDEGSLAVNALAAMQTKEKLFTVQELAEEALKQSLQALKVDDKKTKNGTLPNAFPLDGKANVVIVQYLVRAPFTLTFRLNNSSEQSIEELTASFDAKHARIFGTNRPNLNDFSRSALSNLLGGIGFFNGPIRLTDGRYSQYRSLFTCTPSRSTFPRGFLWDEGFHQLILCEWDRDLCMEMIESWLSTMSDGWISREQIRGYEAESRVAEAFIPQNPNIANPPTLLLAIERLSQSIGPEGLNSHLGEWMQRILPKLKDWMLWLQTTQINEAGSSMWKGRSHDHTLSSGLDDYPRGVIIAVNERHLDLH